MKEVNQHSNNTRGAQAYRLGIFGAGALVLLLMWAAAVHFSSPLYSLLSQSWDLGLTEFQILALPLIVILLFRLRIGSHRSSRPALLIGATGAAVALWFTYTPITTANQIILVAPLANDNLETETTKFRESINSFVEDDVHRGSVRAIRHHAVIKNQREASRALATDVDQKVIVWGNTRLIRLSFPTIPDLRDTFAHNGSASRSAFEITLGLRMVQSVPMIALSFEPPADTARFIAKLYSALSLIGAKSTDIPMAELGLADVGSIAAAWRSFAHRAYPWWLLGNLNLQQALTEATLPGQTFGMGNIDCALRAYAHAHSFLRSGDNPELEAAILNNQAVALYAKFKLLGGASYRKSALRSLRSAVATLKQKNLLGIKFKAAKVARINIKEMRNQAKGSRHGQKTGARSQAKKHKQGAHKKKL